MMRMVVTLACLLVAGCSSQAVSDAVVPKHLGKPVSLVFQKWGVPDRSVKAGGGTIYQWKVNDRQGNCRLEAHGGDPMAGGAQKLIYIGSAGDEQTCVAWLRMLG